MTAVWQQADGERSRKELDKARHDVERLRRALDKAAVEKRDQQQKVAATQQALQVWVFPGDSNADELRQKKELVLWDAPCNSTLTPPPRPPHPLPPCKTDITGAFASQLLMCTREVVRSQQSDV